MKPKRAPSTLGKTGQKFFRAVIREYVFEDRHAIELLTQACSCLDRIHDAAAEVEGAGRFFLDRFGQPKEHPGLVAIRSDQNLFMRLIRELQLDAGGAPETRAPRLKGFYSS